MMMNFIDTAASTVPAAITEAVEPTVAQGSASTCQTKAFGVSFLLTIVTFSFTLTGLITATNWVTDHIVIPRYVNARLGEMSQPLQSLTDTPEAETSVETTSAR